MVRIPDLLRAAAVLVRRTPTEIAIRTGIKVSRVERLFTGRTAPRPDEPARILAACDVDPGLVTTPSARGARALPARTVFGLLLSNHTDLRAAHSGDLDRCAELQVDYLSCSFNASANKLLDLVRVGRLVTPKRTIYRHNYRLGQVLVQHTPCARTSAQHERRSSRVAFNPARASELDWKLVRRVFALADDVRVTRLDVAVDVPVALTRLQVLADKHKTRLYVGPHGVETFYAGPRERQLRMYDKRRQLIDEGRADESLREWTRVEAQLRNLGIGLVELRDIADPFARFAFVELGGKRAGLHLLGASYASTFGVQALRSLDVSPAEVRAIVRDVGTSHALHPSQAFAEQWFRVVSELLGGLGLAVASDADTAARASR